MEVWSCIVSSIHILICQVDGLTLVHVQISISPNGAQGTRGATQRKSVYAGGGREPGALDLGEPESRLTDRLEGVAGGVSGSGSVVRAS